MSKITFIKGQGGMSRQLPGTDHISALIFYATVTLPNFATDKIKQYRDVLAAEADGITADAVDVNVKIVHYHISEFFRINPGAILFIAIYDEPVGALTFSDIPVVQQFAEGQISNFGIWTKKAFDTAQTTLIQGKLDAMATDRKDAYIALFTADFKNITTANLITLRAALDNEAVAVVIAQDGANLGASLFTDAGYSISIIGAILGAVSKAKVSECIGWVEKFPMDETELGVPALANGDLVKNLSTATVEGVDAKGYLFLLKYESNGRVYINDSHTATLPSSDYAYIENNRTMTKAIKQVRSALLPNLNGPVLVDPQSGKLAPEYVTHIENVGDSALENMERAGELSGFKTFVDPDQNVLSTSIVEVAIVNVPVGVSRRFNVKISYATKI